MHTNVSYMIINNVKNLIEYHQITPYQLAKRAGITHGNVRELMNDETVVPRSKALNGICAGLQVNVSDVLKYEPNRVSTKSNKSMNKAGQKQKYYPMADYDVIQQIRENHEQNETLIF